MITKRTIAALGLATLLSASAGAASAASVEFGPGGVRFYPNGFDQQYRDRDTRHSRDLRYSGISSEEAVDIARDNGVRHVQSVDRGRGTFEVSGTDRRHRFISVTIDRDSGRVVDIDRT